MLPRSRDSITLNAARRRFTPQDARLSYIELYRCPSVEVTLLTYLPLFLPANTNLALDFFRCFSLSVHLETRLMFVPRRGRLCANLETSHALLVIAPAKEAISLWTVERVAPVHPGALSRQLFSCLFATNMYTPDPSFTCTMLWVIRKLSPPQAMGWGI